MTQPNPPKLKDLLEICRIKYKKPKSEFMRLLKDLFSNKNSGVASEDAFFELMRRATEFFDELVTVFQPISDELAVRDDGSSNWYYDALLEFISRADNPQKLSILYRELRHPHPHARAMAIENLVDIGEHDREVRKTLYNTLKNGLGPDQET